MMTSPLSDSNTGESESSAESSSQAFERFHPLVRQWIWKQNWSELRDAQERSAEPILAGTRDVIISAATASGKTEAAFLSICSALLNQREDSNYREHSGIKVLYISPLKALINDQYGRLDSLCESLEIPVHRWHGDVSMSHKMAALNEADGILLITPESLEALFVKRGSQVSRFFAGLRYIVVDELHAFIGSERGIQMQSLLHRVEVAHGSRVPRIGLSATIGEMSLAANYLRPDDGKQVVLIVSADGKQELRIQLRGYIASVPSKDPGIPEIEPVEGERITKRSEMEIAEDLFNTLRGTDNLVFANSRRDVEAYTDILSSMCEEAHLSNMFMPHHGSLDKGIREETEAALKDHTKPVTAICTSTLELGIDIGTVTSIAQVGPPPAVSSVRQRLGRSGRRGEPAILRMYISEAEIDEKSRIDTILRLRLVQSIAMVNLLLEGWNESPDAGGLHLSTLVQQLLSVIAQNGGVYPIDAYRTLCSSDGPFSAVTVMDFQQLLRDLGGNPEIRKDFIMQSDDGTLLLGSVGEKVVSHYSFYAAFQEQTEFRIFAQGRQLGTLPVTQPIMVESLLVFAGRRWKVKSVDEEHRSIELTPSKGGKPPTFEGTAGPPVSAKVREEMLRIYMSEDIPIYLDPTAITLLYEARSSFRMHKLVRNRIISLDDDALLFGWGSDRTLSTLSLMLTRLGVKVESKGAYLLFADSTPDAVREVLLEILKSEPPTPLELAAVVQNKKIEKYDNLLSEELLNLDYSRKNINVAETMKLVSILTGQAIPMRQSNDELVASFTPTDGSSNIAPDIID